MALPKSRVDLIFEKIPPIITWTLILFPIWGGFFFPDFTAYVILFLNVYFLYKSITITITLLIAVIRLRKNESLDWLVKLQELDDIDESIDKFQKNREDIVGFDATQITPSAKQSNMYTRAFNSLPNVFKNLVKRYEKQKVLNFIDKQIDDLNKLKNGKILMDWKELRHVVIIPHWKEPEHILEETIERIKASNYPTNKISIVMGAEARDEEGIEISYRLKEKYEQYFDQFIVNKHEMQDGELIGKSSNMYSASKFAYEYFEKLGWDFTKVTVTSCDADSKLSSDYFANLAYLYITTKDYKYKFYTGAVLLYANIWRLPFFARVKNSMSTLYNLLRLVRTDKLVPFSTYSLSFWLIKEIGFWSPDITPEDFHTFFKAHFKYPNKVETIPIYQRILSDSAEGSGLYDTMMNNYFQERRWAWGVSDDGWILKNLVHKFINKSLPLKTLYMGLHTIWDHLSVGVAMIITYGGNLVVLVNPRFSYTVLGANLAKISSFLIQLSLLFFLFTVILDRYIKPAPLKKRGFIMNILGFFEWFLQPIIGIILITIPGIEAHTRLLFGKYLEYYLTKKK